MISESKQLEYDKHLQHLAAADFNAFCKMMGIDKLQAYIALERSMGSSYGQIAVKLRITKKKVEYRCRKLNAVNVVPKTGDTSSNK